MRAAFCTDRGRVRQGNEDAVLALPEQGIAVLADGMGGHVAGEVASRMAVEIVSSHLMQGLELLSSHSGDDPMRRLMSAAIGEANTQIVAHAAGSPEFHGMGTTIVAALIRAGQVHLAHVGDSRAYAWDGGVLQQLTTDHTVVSDLLAVGAISEREAAKHPHRSVLTRALGAEADVQVDCQSLPLPAGKIILLCSDGLYGMVADRKIGKLLKRYEQDMDRACEALIREANDEGGRDNISVVLLTEH